MMKSQNKIPSCLKIVLLCALFVMASRLSLAQTNSAPNSANSTQTTANSNDALCNKVIEDLKSTKTALESTDAENKLLFERLDNEKQKTDLQGAIISNSAKESTALRETINAKDAIINAQTKQIELLNEAIKRNKKPPSLVTRIGLIVLGATIIKILNK